MNKPKTIIAAIFSVGLLLIGLITLIQPAHQASNGVQESFETLIEKVESRAIVSRDEWIVFLKIAKERDREMNNELRSRRQITQFLGIALIVTGLLQLGFLFWVRKLP